VFVDKFSLIQNEIHNSLDNLFKEKKRIEIFIEKAKEEGGNTHLLNNLYSELDTVKEAMNFFYNLDATT